jgi:hypothetical protein
LLLYEIGGVAEKARSRGRKGIFEKKREIVANIARMGEKLLPVGL